MVLPVPNPGDTGHVSAHDTIAGILNDPATNWAQGNATYVAASDSTAILSAAHTSAGNVAVTYKSNWGVNGQGNAYHDPAGAVVGEEAAAFIDSTGNLVVSKINL